MISASRSARTISSDIFYYSRRTTWIVVNADTVTLVNYSGSSSSTPLVRSSRFRDELGHETGLESLDAFLGAVAALLHAAERRFRHRDREAVDPDHAGLDLLAQQVHA